MEIDKIYSDPPIQIWKYILGNDIHYHFGVQTTDNDKIDELGMNRIHQFYPFIDNNSNILEIGCGWGAVLNQLKNEKNCYVSGITISKKQFEYCTKEKKLNVIYANIEEISLFKHYDYICMVEVLCHIKDKKGLFSKLALNTNKLLLSVIVCSNKIYKNSKGYGGLTFVTKNELFGILKETGWDIIWCNSCMKDSKKTIEIWKTNIQNNNNFLKYEQINDLYNTCTTALANWELWLKKFDSINLFCIKKI